MTIRTNHKTIIELYNDNRNKYLVREVNLIKFRETEKTGIEYEVLYSCYFRPWELNTRFSDGTKILYHYSSDKGNISPYRIILDQISKIKKEYYGN